MNKSSSISKYYKSFSGTDTLVFILMPGSKPVVLGSITTVSYSVYRNKKPVINIGRTNINGVTRGSRIYAGTMIFTLINQHWLNELKEQESLAWLNQYEDLKADELPLFDIMVVSANEYGSYVSMFIYGIDFTDEAQTISVEDLFTENTFSFVARDISTFKAGTQNSMGKSHSSGSTINSLATARIHVLPESGVSVDDIATIEKEFAEIQAQNKETANKLSKLSSFTRELEYSTSGMLIGSDVATVQGMLNATNVANLNINGIYDKTTENAVKSFQSLKGLGITGKIDEMTYLALQDSTSNNGTSIGIVINKSGTNAYLLPDMNSNTISVKEYKEQVILQELLTNDKYGYSQKFYKTPEGYVLADDIFSYQYNNNITEFPIIKLNDKSYYVTMLQDALSSIDANFTGYSNGVYDELTENKVKEIQASNDLIQNGIVDNNVWIIIQNLARYVINGYQSSEFSINFANAPGEYTVNDIDLNTLFLQGFNVTISSEKTINVMATVISYFGDKTRILTKTYPIQGSSQINFIDFEKAFLYDLEYKSTPNKIEYIIYPYGKEAYKWSINYI